MFHHLDVSRDGIAVRSLRWLRLLLCVGGCGFSQPEGAPRTTTGLPVLS